MRIRGLILAALGLASGISAVASAAPSVAEGKQLASSQSCLMCHASGAMAKPLAAYRSDSEAQLKAAILDPKKALGAATMMPSYQGRLSAEQLDSLLAYIKAG